MEKKEFVKLYHEITEDIEFHPDWSRMECFIAMAERASLICMESKKNHESTDKISDSERQGESKNQIKDNDIEVIELPPDGLHPNRSALYCSAATADRVPFLEEKKTMNTKKRHACDDSDNYNNNNNNGKEYQAKPKKKVKMEENIIQKQQPKIFGISLLLAQTLPAEHMNALEILANGKRIEEIKLVLKKDIFQTDISKKHNRLSLPKNLFKCSFLREEEIQYLKSVKENNHKNTNSIEVDIIEPSLEICKLDLREWAISNGMYVLTKGWNKLVARNSIEVNQILEIWTARVDQKLCFLLVRIPTNNS